MKQAIYLVRLYGSYMSEPFDTITEMTCSSEEKAREFIKTISIHYRDDTKYQILRTMLDSLEPVDRIDY